MRKPYLSIIIPAFNLWEFTRGCLQSLYEHTRGSFFEVIVIDNGSTDSTPVDCPLLGRTLFGDNFKFIRLAENINFGPACNLGAEKARGELLFFLNNDTRATENWVIPLLDFFRKNSGNYVCSPLCLFPENGRVQHLGIAFDAGGGLKHPYFLFPHSHRVVNKNRKIQALSAAALMVSRKTFLELGCFYPDYVNGFEDIDFCCRFRKAGGRLHLEYRSVIEHFASTTPGRNKRDSENLNLVNTRCCGWFKTDLHKIAREDGFRCEFTPWLDMIMVDPELEQLAEHDLPETSEELAILLNKYPLWGAAYDKITLRLMEEGNPIEALEYAYLGSFHCPEIKRFKRVEELAQKEGDSDKANYAAARLVQAESALLAPEQLEAALNRISLAAEKMNDEELIRICVNFRNDIL
jgi:hypothetical protein